MQKGLYYTAPLESFNYIKQNGILPPKEVFKLIDEGKLPRSVLGCSTFSRLASYHRNHLSLESLEEDQVPYMIINLRTRGKGNLVTYLISEEIRQRPEFVDENNKKIKTDWRTFAGTRECFFNGTILPHLILSYEIIKELSSEGKVFI